MKFRSKKDLAFSLTILGINSLLIGLMAVGIINEELETNEYWILILILAVIGLLFWVYFGTYYELSKEKGLIYKSGPISGRIELERITEIVKGKTLWTGFKLATSRKGLILKYDKYDEIYISPESNEVFIEKILELNGNIKITE